MSHTGGTGGPCSAGSLFPPLPALLLLVSFFSLSQIINKILKIYITQSFSVYVSSMLDDGDDTDGKQVSPILSVSCLVLIEYPEKSCHGTKQTHLLFFFFPFIKFLFLA